MSDEEIEETAPEEEAEAAADSPEEESPDANEPETAEGGEPAPEDEGAPTPDEPATGGEAEAVVETAEEPAESAPVARKAESDLPPGADLEPIPIEPEDEPELDAEEKARREAEAEERAAREKELEESEVPVPAGSPAKLDGDARYHATGKRKRSVARVTILPGDGRIVVNGREIDEYFPRSRHRTVVRSPLVGTGYEDTVEVRVRVHGGGVSGQAGAVRHGIARGLTEAAPGLRPELKKRGFLTRDSRAKERRKAGLKKARKRPQFSKR